MFSEKWISALVTISKGVKKCLGEDFHCDSNICYAQGMCDLNWHHTQNMSLWGSRLSECLKSKQGTLGKELFLSQDKPESQITGSGPRVWKMRQMILIFSQKKPMLKCLYEVWTTVLILGSFYLSEISWCFYVAVLIVIVLPCNPGWL